MNHIDKKKKVLLTIIEKLIWTWDIASWVYLLVNNSKPEDPIIDQVLEIMKKSLKNIGDWKLKDKIIEGISILEKMKEMERIDREKELLELDEILKQLDEL